MQEFSSAFLIKFLILTHLHMMFYRFIFENLAVFFSIL